MLNSDHRIKKRPDFVKTAKVGSKFFAKSYILQVMPAEKFRYGITASKKIGNAVIRNKAKRRIRAIIALLFKENLFKSANYVIIAKKYSIEVSFTEAENDLRQLVNRVNFIKSDNDDNKKDIANIDKDI
jgi:ribonuclease P protein component